MFSGYVHDLESPLRERLESRRYGSPYIQTSTAPGGERGFYLEGQRLACARYGSPFDLRLAYVKNRWGDPTAFYTDPDGAFDPMKAITARLPHSRGFLAGWTLGEGMCATLDTDTIHDTIEEAERAAVSMTEHAAEREAEYRAEATRRADEVAGLGTDE